LFFSIFNYLSGKSNIGDQHRDGVRRMRRSGATNSETERGREDLLSGGKIKQFREIEEELSRFSKKKEVK
jgi:hypothetical protein